MRDRQFAHKFQEPCFGRRHFATRNTAMIHKHDQTPANPPIVDMRKIGQSLGLPWSHARKLIEGAGIRVIEEAGAPRSWFVSGSAWRRFCEEHQLEVLS